MEKETRIELRLSKEDAQRAIDNVITDTMFDITDAISKVEKTLKDTRSIVAEEETQNLQQLLVGLRRIQLENAHSVRAIASSASR